MNFHNSRINNIVVLITLRLAESRDERTHVKELTEFVFDISRTLSTSSCRSLLSVLSFRVLIKEMVKEEDRN